MSQGDVRAKKEAYVAKLERLLSDYQSILVINVDNVGSQQMHDTRRKLRGTAEILMGKNTMIRRYLRANMAENPSYEGLLAYVQGNIGFVFTNADLSEIRDELTKDRVTAPAKSGAIAPCPVVIPAGPTGMEPGKTAFFQALGVPTKIARGTIEITSDVTVIEVGGKVGPSEAILLNMMNISPFTYGISVVVVYDQGATFSPEILDITDDLLIESFMTGIKTIASISLAIEYPTVAAVPHSVINGYKNILAVAIASENYSFPAADELKELLNNPEALAALANAAAAPAAGDAAPAAAAAAVVEESESESDGDFDLFD